MISKEKLEALEIAIDEAYNDTDYNSKEWQVLREMKSLLRELTE